jgi:hypothetical protein
LDSGPLPDVIINEVLYGVGSKHPDEDVSRPRRAQTDDFARPSTSTANDDEDFSRPKRAKTDDPTNDDDNEDNKVDQPENAESVEASLSRLRKLPVPSIHEIGGKQTRINDIFVPVPSTSKDLKLPVAPPTSVDDYSPIPSQLTVMSYNIGK